MLGRSPVPVYDPERKLFPGGNAVLAGSGDRFKLRPVDLDEYKDIRMRIKGSNYRLKMVNQKFDLRKYLSDRENYLKSLENELGDV